MTEEAVVISVDSTDVEIAAARLVQVAQANPQAQTRIVWPADVVVAKAYLDQLARGSQVPAAGVQGLRRSLTAAERVTGARRKSALEGVAAQAETLATSNVPRVVAVSCNPATLARDARILVDGGYRLERVVPVDQFHWSPEIEVVATFAR